MSAAPKTLPSRGISIALLAAAVEARANAYAPYSSYRVGAALITSSGRVYAGANVENASFGATLCAERAAIAAMVAAGDRSPVACLVATAGPRPGTPCGICRQVLAEFSRDMPILLRAVDDRSGQVVARRNTRLGALLPDAFGLITKNEASPRRGVGRAPLVGV